MEYYLQNSHTTFGDNGNDKKQPFIRRVLLTWLSLIGTWPRAWRLFDFLVGLSPFNLTKLKMLADGYEKVTLVQSASWGLQDQALARMARQRKWRTVMIPYTTDQLFCNGYLYSSFDAVCVQGPFEEWCASNFHNIPATRTISLGSVWFRYIDEIKQQVGRGWASRANRPRRKIMYAGSSSRHFPRSSEYLGLETLLKAIETGELSDVELIYRPLGESAEIRTEIQERYGGTPNLVIQFAQRACYGLDEYGGGSQREELEEYVAQLLEADLVVMCLATTLALDAAYLGVPTISYLADPTRTLHRRHTHLRFNQSGRFPLFEAIPVIHSVRELVPTVKEILSDKGKAASIARETASQWDFPKTDFRKTLRETINPDEGAGSVLKSRLQNE